MIKLMACALQQVVIGGMMRQSVRIRAAVAVNAPVMRAISVMMSEPRLTPGKVAMLVGGPDWPTSVMMGLLGMRLGPMLAGTTPIICLIAPLTMCGAFMIRGDEPPYRELTHITMALSSLTQLGAFLLLMYYVERTTQTKRDELEALPYDEEVLKLNQAEQEYNALYAELTNWHSPRVPLGMRAALSLGALSGMLACYGATLYDSRCFEEFKLADPDFETQLRSNLRGNVLNLIKPNGWAVVGLGVLCYACRYVFVAWASRLVKARYKAGQRATAPSGREATRRAATRRAADRGTAVESTTAASGGHALQQEPAGSHGGGGTAAAAPAGGRKLSAKSKPFWELQQEKEAKGKQEAPPPQPPQPVAHARPAGTTGAGLAFAAIASGGQCGDARRPDTPPRSEQPVKDRPPRQHRHRSGKNETFQNPDPELQC